MACGIVYRTGNVKFRVRYRGTPRRSSSSRPSASAAIRTSASSNSCEFEFRSICRSRRPGAPSIVSACGAPSASHATRSESDSTARPTNEFVAPAKYLP